MSKPKNKTCFDQQYLQRYLEERLSEPDEADVQSHISSCPECQQSLELAAADQTIWTEIKKHVEPDTSQAEQGSFDHRSEQLLKFLGPTDDPEMLGRIGRYEVIGVIGQGSTGIVLKALEPSLNRIVAIKVLSPVYASNGAARKRFEREGRAVAAVTHQHVVPIYAVDEFHGTPFIVMQYIPGLSLLQRIEKDGSLDTCEVTRIGLQIANGLAAAHDQGIVHRDVKPANVMLENTVDRAMVTDFGLARVIDDASMTRSGTITGTPQYMSPEQARGENVDARSDLFSLGSLLYAACTGRPPFRAETLIGVINRVCQSDPRPIREINPMIEPWLAAFVTRLMNKEPDNRFQSAREAAEILGAELAFIQNPTNSPRPNRDWMPIKQAARSGLVAPIIGMAVLVGCLTLLLGPWSGFPMMKGLSFNSGGGNASATPLDGFESEDNEPAEIDGPAKISWQENINEWNTDDDSTVDQKLERVFSIGESGSILVDSDRADLVLQPSELDDRVHVTLLRRVTASSRDEAKKILKKHVYRFGATNDQLTINCEAPEKDSSKFQRVLYRITVPQSFNGNLITRNGDIKVGSIDGTVIATTQSGSIEFDRIDGDVKAEASGGDIRIKDGSTGDVELLTVNGNIYAANIDGEGEILTSGGNVWLGANSGKVYVQTSGGSVKVANVDGPTKVYAGEGNVDLTVTKTPSHESTFSSARGTVNINVRADVATSIQSRGNLVSDLESAEVPADDDDSSGIPWIENQLNGGGVTVRAISPLGKINVNVIDANSSASLGGSGLGGSGYSDQSPAQVAYIREKTSGEPRPGAIATVELTDSDVMDGYTLYLPESHDMDHGPYPVLVYLQGGYGVGGPIENVNRWGLMRLIRDERELDSERNQLLLDSMIVISPHINGGQYYDHAELVQQIIESVSEDFNGDLDRVYMTGLSRGGHGTWGLAAKLPDTFAAIAPIGGDFDCVKDYAKIGESAIWIAHNRGDKIISFSESEKAVKKIEASSDSKFLEINSPDVSGTDYLTSKHILQAAAAQSHDAWTNLYTSVEFYRWLLQQSK